MTTLLVMTPLNAEIYKWVDESGRVHYSSQKPADEPVEKIKVNTAPTGTVTGKKALQDEQEATAAEEQRIKEEGIPEKPPVPALSAAEVRQRCQTARQSLQQILSRGGQLRERGKDGEIRYLGEEQRQARIAEQRRRIKQYCN